MTTSEWPPSTFNLSTRVFRPVPPATQTPGLSSQIQRLVGEGRFRSALDVLLPLLAEDPENQEALWLAMLTLGHSRSDHVQAIEPLGERYRWDPRLDPLFAVCSGCRSTTWAPANCLFAGSVTHVAALGASGLQCRQCGYVICQRCLSTARNTDPNPGRVCPHCGQERLATPVYPTGRAPMQMERTAARVRWAVLFREGPVPPDIEYMRTILDQRSPDAVDDGAHLIGVPVFPWPDDIRPYARCTLTQFATDGRISSLALSNAPAGLFRDDAGLNVYIVKMFDHRRQA